MPASHRASKHLLLWKTSLIMSTSDLITMGLAPQSNNKPLSLKIQPLQTICEENSDAWFKTFSYRTRKICRFPEGCETFLTTGKFLIHQYMINIQNIHIFLLFRNSVQKTITALVSNLQHHMNQIWKLNLI